MKNILKSRIVCYFLGILTILGVVSVFAYTYNASDVGFTPTDEYWQVDRTDTALDDLYDRINTEITSGRAFLISARGDGMSLYHNYNPYDSKKIST